jgi:Zn-dependent M28 family amino/carboxypeptidase
MRAIRAGLIAPAMILLALAAVSGAPGFDAGRAFEHIRQLTAIGPRPPGSPGSAAARRYITGELTKAGIAAREQTFQAATPLGPIPMANVIGVIEGASRERILLGGHYDTKLFRQFRFVGANDGGSSTAILLELGRVLKARRNPFTIELVFFDGEEALVDWTGTDHTYGSRHYVAEARRGGTLAGIRALILFDMIADRDLTIRRESYSTDWLTDLIWASARRLGHGRAFLDERLAVEDDHKPFIEAGVPAVNVIDLEYAVWHTPRDTIDQVSARSIQTVADVFLDALPRIEAKLRENRGDRK